MGETVGWENEGRFVRRTYENKVPGEQRRTVLPTNLPEVSAGCQPPVRPSFCPVPPALLLPTRGKGLCSCPVLCLAWSPSGPILLGPR